MKTKTRNAVPLSSRTSRAAAILAAAVIIGAMPASPAQPAPSNLNIVSDTSWVSTATEPVVPSSLATWVNPAYNDSSWGHTLIVTGYPYPPAGYIPGTIGKHIWHDPHATTTAWFRKTFVIPGFPRASQGVVRVDDAYDFYVNGILAGSKHTAIPAGAQSYDITAYLREGVNVFAIKGWDILTSDRALLFDANIGYIPNSLPIANAGPDQVVPPGTVVALDGSGTTDDHTLADGLTCLWTIESTPPGGNASLTNGHTLQPTLTPDVPGVYIARLVVLDASGLQGIDEMSVTVSDPMPNGSFEQDFDGWNTSGNLEVSTSPAPTDGAKLVAFNAGNLPPDGIVSRTFGTTWGCIYMVTFDAGILAYDRGSQALQVTATGVPSGIVRASQTFPIDGPSGGRTTWKPRSLFFKAYDAETRIEFRDVSAMTRSMDLLLDNVKITDVSSLRNGGFESGLTGWTAGGNVEIKYIPPYQPTEGTKLAAFNCFNTAPDGMLTQYFNVAPGMEHILSFDMGVLAYNTNEQCLQIEIQGVTVPGLFKIRGTGDGKTRWETIRLPFTANYDVISVKFIDASPTSASIDLLLDGVKVEPASRLMNSSFELGFHAWAESGNVAVRSTLPYVPSDRSKAAVFNSGNSAPNGALTQQLFFATTPGMIYPLSFDMGVLSYIASPQSLQVDVEEPGVPTQSWTFTANGNGDGKCRWVTRRLAFTTSSGFARITFRDVSTATNAIDLLLDNIRIVPPPAGFTQIAAGNFQMGDSLGDGGGFGELPVHTVFVSTFLMAQTETTKALWDGVRTWAATHGYTDLAEGTSNGSLHPVANVTWPDVVKWCNARSEMEGLQPCYTLSGSVFRTGTGDPVECDWTADGYRLPSEAEWEKAARGGVEGLRFPWGNVINHNHTGFWDFGYLYESSWNKASLSYYHTTPVGSYPANRFGLHDMAGNVAEYCWDRWLPGYYAISPGIDPHGPDTSPGLERIVREGGMGVALYLRAAQRSFYHPINKTHTLGFRVARSL